MRCAGSRTYPKLLKKWSTESEADGLSCEAARENSQPTSTKQYFFLCISNHIAHFHEHFVERNNFGGVSDVVVWKIYVCNDGLR